MTVRDIAALSAGSATLPPFLQWGEDCYTREAEEAAIAWLNERCAVIITGNRVKVLKERVRPNGRIDVCFLSTRDFRDHYSNYRICDRNGKAVSIATWWLNAPARRTYEGLVFAPDGGPEDCYNLWRGWAFRPAPKPDPTRFGLLLDHVKTNLCGGDDQISGWVWGWIAHMIQHPCDRIGTALVVRGHQGAGKSILGKIIGDLMPDHSIIADNPRYITGNFNAHMADCLLIQAEESFWAGDKVAEGRLKSLITSDHHMIERKGLDPTLERNLVRMIVTSNADWVIPAGLEERRFCVLNATDGRLQDHTFFAALQQQMNDGGYEHLLAWLLAYDLAGLNLRQIPATTGLAEQKIHSLNLEESWLFEVLHEGRIGYQDWPDEIPTETLYGSYSRFVDRLGRKGKKAPTAFGKAIHKMMPQGFTRRRGAERCVYGDDGLIKHGPDGIPVRTRPWVYDLPTLDAARCWWDAMTRTTTDWGEDVSPVTPPAAGPVSVSGEGCDPFELHD